MHHTTHHHDGIITSLIQNSIDTTLHSKSIASGDMIMSRPFFYKSTGILLFIIIVTAFIFLRSASLDRSYKNYLIGRTNPYIIILCIFFREKRVFSRHHTFISR